MDPNHSFSDVLLIVLIIRDIITLLQRKIDSTHSRSPTTSLIVLPTNRPARANLADTDDDTST